MFFEPFQCFTNFGSRFFYNFRFNNPVVISEWGPNDVTAEFKAK